MTVKMTSTHCYCNVTDTNTKKQIMKSKFQLGHLVASFGFVLKNYFNNDGGRGT